MLKPNSVFYFILFFLRGGGVMGEGEIQHKIITLRVHFIYKIPCNWSIC